MTLPDPARLEASIRSRIERLADEHVRDDPAGRQQWIERLRRELAYRRLLVRLVAAEPGAWFLKGGLALQFRLDPSRASLDVDLGLLSAADTAAAEVALRPRSRSISVTGSPSRPARRASRATTMR